MLPSYVNREHFEILNKHSLHELVVNVYDENEIAIECEDCFEILLTVYKEEPE